MCIYQRGTIECRGDGYCWDADHDGYDEDDHSLPCPKCNTREFLQDEKEHAETTSHGYCNSYRYTGESLWIGAVKHALEWNKEEAEKVLAEIGTVEALRPAHNKEGYETVQFIYREAA
jgi:hypothetical protein